MRSVNPKNLSLRALNVFLEVYDTRSASQAAELFQVNQSTISYTLESLRTIFGDPLFRKVGRTLEPTPFASQIEPKLRNMANEFDSIFAQAPLDELLSEAPITIASSTTSLTCLLSNFCKLSRKHFPGLKFIFRDFSGPDNAVELLTKNVADVVISPRVPKYVNPLKVKHLVSEKHLTFYDPNQRGPILDIKDFMSAEHGVLEFGKGRKSILEKALANEKVPRKIVLSAPNAYCLAQLIKGTEIVATLNSSLANSAMSDLASCNVPVEGTDINFDVLWHVNEDNSPRTQWILARLEEAALAHADKNKGSFGFHDMATQLN